MTAATESLKSPMAEKASEPKQTGPSMNPKLAFALDMLIVAGLTIYISFAWVRHPEQIAFPAFIYFCTIIKILTKRIDNAILLRPFELVYGVVSKPFMMIPTKIRHIALAFSPFVLAAIAISTIPNSESGNTMDRFRSLLGLVCIMILMFITSTNRRAISLRLVGMGMLLQFLLALFVLKTQPGKDLFRFISQLVADFLHLGKSHGLAFLWSGLDDVHSFIVDVLPAIIFFASFIQVIYYLGAMQWIVIKFGWIMMRLMDTSGSESVVAAASPFVGMGESALLVKPFLEFMTESELHQVMASGFATIAGSVLSAFLALGIDGTSLVSSCIMSIPCSLALAKMHIPETEQSLTKGSVTVPEEDPDHREANCLHAAANGAAQGLHLAGLIAGTLLAIMSLYALCDIVVVHIFKLIDVPFSIEKGLSYLFYPFAWAMGVPLEDCFTVAALLGKKMVVNEFAAFMRLKEYIEGKVENNVKLHLTHRGQIIATYALCGFANIASVGIQIGCLGAMAPSRRADIARLAFRAMLVGTMCTFCSASIAGILL